MEPTLPLTAALEHTVVATSPGGDPTGHSSTYGDGSTQGDQDDHGGESAVVASADQLTRLSSMMQAETISHGVVTDDAAAGGAQYNFGDYEVEISATGKPRKRRRGTSPTKNAKPRTLSTSSTSQSQEGANRYVCNICGYSTNHNWILKRHHLTHSGEKPFPCDICGKSFRQKAHLSGHKRIHTGEKSFACNTCGESFKRSDALKKHRLQHDEDGYAASSGIIAANSLTEIATSMVPSLAPPPPDKEAPR